MISHAKNISVGPAELVCPKIVFDFLKWAARKISKIGNNPLLPIEYSELEFK